MRDCHDRIRERREGSCSREFDRCERSDRYEFDRRDRRDRRDRFDFGSDCWSSPDIPCEPCQSMPCQSMPCELCAGVLPGGWTSFTKPNRQQIAVFNQATLGLIGVNYKPLYVAAQIVAGTNYTFLAEATTITGIQCTTDIVAVSVTVALNGAVTLNSVTSIISLF